MSDMVVPVDEGKQEPMPLADRNPSQPFEFSMVTSTGSTLGGPPGPGIDGMPDSLTGPGGPGNPPPMPNMGMQPGGMQQPQQPQKSHLAEILGSHEMNQLKTMSRSSDYGSTGGGGVGGGGPPNMPPTQTMNRPNNPGMMGGMSQFDRFPNHFPNQMQHPAFMGSVPPGSQPMNPNFRFNAPNPVRNVNPNFGDQGHGPGHGSHGTSPSVPTPPVEQPKPTTKRPRRPSRKSSRDGEDPEPRRKRKSKVDESGATGKQGRKRKTKNPGATGIPDGQLYMFSTQMLNDAADQVNKKKQSTMVNYHQNLLGNSIQPTRLTAKSSTIPSSTTPPIPSGMPGQSLPGVRPNPHAPHRASPGMVDHNRGMNPVESPMSAMSPISNVMSPLGHHVIPGRVPGRVPTPQGADGRLTPGSQQRSVMTPNSMHPGMPPLSPAHSQDSRIPTPNAHSPATAPSPSPSNPASIPGNEHLQHQQQHHQQQHHQQRPPSHHNNNQTSSTTNQSQEEKINKIQEIREKMLGPQTPGSNTSTRNPTPPGMTTMDTLRQSEKRQNGPMNPTSHGTPENPSPGPPNGPNSNPHQNPIGANPEQIEMIKMFQQRQSAAAKHQMMMNPNHYAGYGPPHQMRHSMGRTMDPMMGPGGYGMRPNMRYPAMGGYGRIPINHAMGGFHPGMPQMGPRMGQMPMGGSRFPPNDPRLRPGMNQNFSFSEQLRQQAAMYTTHRPDISFGPGGPGGPQRFPGQQANMMPGAVGAGGDPSNPTANAGGPGNFGPGGAPGQPGATPGSGGPPHQNGDFMGQYPSSYSPSAQINQQGAQNGPGMMSPMSNQMGAGNAPMTNGPVNGPTGGPPSTNANSSSQDSPYPNQAKSPAGSQMNGPITSPSPSQGGPPSIAPSVPEMHPLTPQGAQPLSPACTNPMTPVSHHGGPNTPGGPVTPGDVYAGGGNPGSNAPMQHNAPMTPLTNPLTPGGNPVTPGPATPVAPNNPLADLEAPLSNQNMPPCSPMTPQNAQNLGNPGAGNYPNRPEAPLTPSTPNGPTSVGPITNGPHGKMQALIGENLSSMDLSSIIPATDQSMGGGNAPHMPMHTGQNNYYGPRMASHPGMHPSGHPGMGGMGMGNRMMGINHQQMGMMTSPQMTHHPSYATQWGGYPSGPRY